MERVNPWIDFDFSLFYEIKIPGIFTEILTSPTVCM